MTLHPKAAQDSFHYPQIGGRARKPKRPLLSVILRLAGGQVAALNVGQEPGIASGVAWRISGPTAQPHTSLGQRPRISKNSAFSAESAFHITGGMERAFSAIPLWLNDLVCCNTITFALQEWRWSRVGLPISASASWSAGSPLPLSQAGQSFAYGSFPLPSELSATLRQRMLPLELTPDVARRTAKAVEDYPHSKTLTRLPSPSRLFALCHRPAIRTDHCYSLLEQFSKTFPIQSLWNPEGSPPVTGVSRQERARPPDRVPRPPDLCLEST